MTAKKTSSKGNEKGITKAGFIRSLPDRTPAKDVIAKAKEAGLDLKEKHVWTVQSEMRSEAKGGAKKSAKKATKKAAQATSAAAASATPTAPAKSAPAKSKSKKSPKKKSFAKVVVKTATSAESGSAEHRMKSLIVQLGTTRADELYRSVRKELDALVGR